MDNFKLLDTNLYAFSGNKNKENSKNGSIVSILTILNSLKKYEIRIPIMK